MKNKYLKGNSKNRPNKLSQGIQYTFERSKPNGHNSPVQYRRAVLNRKNDVNRLMVLGTLDSLAKSINWNTSRHEKTKCHCCGHMISGKLRLSDKGRSKLKSLKKRYWERNNMVGWASCS